MMKMLPEGLATEGDVAQEKKKGKKGKMVAGGAAAQLRRPMASHALVRARWKIVVCAPVRRPHACISLTRASAPITESHPACPAVFDQNMMA